MPSKLKHITIGYPRRPFIDVLEANSRWNGADFVHLPRHWGAGAFGVVNKITVLKAYLDSGEVDMGDVLLFTDAYDTLLVEHSSQILAKFHSCRADLVVGGEAHFWPSEGRESVKSAFEVYDGKWRYLNSGGYIGYAWAVRQMVDFCADKLARGEWGFHKPDDQALVQQFFIAHRTDTDLRIRLDFAANIFACLNTTVDDFDVAHGTVFHKKSRQSVSVIHANAAKENMDILYRHWTLVGGAIRSARDWDLRVATVPNGVISYDPGRKKLVLSGKADGLTLVFLVKGERTAIALIPALGLGTFTREKEVHHDAVKIAGWEVLTTRPEVTTFHGHNLAEHFPAAYAGPAPVLSPLPLSFFLQPALDDAVELAARYESQF